MAALSIVLATPPGFNPGMTATEFGLTAFLRRHELAAEAACYRLVRFADRLGWMSPDERAASELRAETGLDARSAFDELDAILASRAILFWADYLHMGIYLRELEPVVAAEPALRGLDVPAAVRRLLLLEGASDATLARAVSFGTTLLFNTLRDESNPAYVLPLRRFLTCAKRVWVRDPLSAARVAHLTGDYDTGYLGVDAALLLTRADVLREAAEHGITAPRHAGAVLTFFGREPALRERLTATAREIAAALDRPLLRLAWGDRGGFPHLDADAGAEDDTGARTARELVYEVAHAAAVVTDTYHLALIAWNLGVPAVCAFAGHAPDENDVSSGAAFSWRDKREVFASQYDALDFLIRPEEMLNGGLSARRTAHLREVIADRALQRAITGRMHAHAAAVEGALARELSALLGEAVCR